MGAGHLPQDHQIFGWTEPRSAPAGQLVQYVQVFSNGGEWRTIRIRDRHGLELMLELQREEFTDLVQKLAAHADT